MDITPLDPYKVDQIWFKVKDYFEAVAATTHGRYTANDIREQTKAKQHHLWIAHEGEEIYGFVTTGFCSYPQMRCLIMHFTAGKELDKWKTEMLNALQEFAKMNGCEAIESFGRTGWAKVFKHDGYKPLQTFYELPVEAV